MDKILNNKLTLDSIDLKSSLRQHFGFDKFKGSQEEIINNLLKGNNTFVIMPTGGGNPFVISCRRFFLTEPQLSYLL